MSEPQAISSRQSPHIKRLLHLQKTSQRKKEEVFLIEGFRELSRALAAGVKLEVFYFAEAFFTKEIAYELLEQIIASAIPTFSLTRDCFEKVSTREGPDGFLAIAKNLDLSLDCFCLKQNPLIGVIESIEKPGNLGALIRTAEAAGLDGLVLIDPILDPLGPAVIRNAQGALFTLPLAISTYDAFVVFSKRYGLKWVATTPSAEKLYWDADLAGPLALIMGSEKDGLTERFLEAANIKVKIPLHGASDSLNLATAGALIVYEALRQRR